MKKEVNTTYKILLVDDDSELIAVLCDILEMKNYQVITACNGQEGLEKAKETMPDLVISDIMMPVMNGYELCEKLKNDPITKNIPVIMVTAKDMGNDVDMALEKKADWYIVKPIESKYLLKKIENLIKR